MPDVSGVILGGGKGSRLGGTNKALLDVGGRTTLQRVLQALRELEPREMILVTNDDVLAGAPGLHVVLDPEPHAGVLPALLAGLEAATAELCVTAAVDMPFLSPALYHHLLAQADAHDVVIPEIGGQLEPMCAVYRRVTCAPAIRSALARGERRMISFYDRVRVLKVTEPAVRVIDPDLLALFNVNTQEDLARAREWAAHLAES